MIFICEKRKEEVSNIYLSTEKKYVCWDCLTFSDKMWHRSMDTELRNSKMAIPETLNTEDYKRAMKKQPLISINGQKL